MKKQSVFDIQGGASPKPLATHFKSRQTFEIQESFSPKSKRPLRQTWWRWAALVLVNLLILGNFMALEGPQPIETQIIEKLYLNEEQYSLLYSSWALPSILSPLFGGYLIDRFGCRPTLIAFSLLVTLGQFVYTYGGYALSFSWLMIGRTVYAFGTDPLNVVQMVLINKWFNGKELAFAISLSGSTFGIGRALNSALSPLIYEQTHNLGTPMMFQAVICLVGTAIAFLMVKWDSEDEKRELAINPDYLKRKTSTEKITMSDVKYFDRIVWLLIINFGLLFGCSFSLNAFTNNLYSTRYQFTNAEAGNIISTNFIVLAVSAAFIGKIVDKHGHRASLLTASSVFGLFGFLYFLIVPTGDKPFSSIIPQLIFGFQLGIGEAVLCPSLPLVLKEKYLGTGFGLLFVIENVLVFIFPVAAAFIKNFTAIPGVSDGYSGMLIYFFFWNCLTVLTSVLLYVEDKKHGKILETSIMVEDNLKQQMITDLDQTAINRPDEEEEITYDI